VHGVEGHKSSPIYNISKTLKTFKQERDNKEGTIQGEAKETLKDVIENEITEEIASNPSNPSNESNEKAMAKEYLVNSYQRQFYTELVYELNLHEDIRKNSLVLALRAGSNLDQSLFTKAMAAVRKLDMHLNFGGTVKSIPALFQKIYSDKIKYSEYNKQQAEQAAAPQKRDTSFYYDWTEEA